MKRLITIYGKGVDQDTFDIMAANLRKTLEDNKYESILFSGPKDTIIQILELEDGGEYRCITVNKKGVKIQKVPIEHVTKW